MNENTYTLEQFTAEAVCFARALVPHEKHATILALQGDLGAGKTTFTQTLARELGVDEMVVSPTFVIEKIYPLSPPRAKWERLIHIDAYRLESAHELEVLNWQEIVADPGNLIVIEWPENVDSALPEYAQHINFTYIDDETRKIEFG